MTNIELQTLRVVLVVQIYMSLAKQMNLLLIVKTFVLGIYFQLSFHRILFSSLLFFVVLPSLDLKLGQRFQLIAIIIV